MNKPLINFSKDQFKEMIHARCADFDYLERELLDGFLDAIEDVEDRELKHAEQIEELEDAKDALEKELDESECEVRNLEASLESAEEELRDIQKVDEHLQHINNVLTAEVERLEALI